MGLGMFMMFRSYQSPNVRPMSFGFARHIDSNPLDPQKPRLLRLLGFRILDDRVLGGESDLVIGYLDVQSG